MPLAQSVTSQAGAWLAKIHLLGVIVGVDGGVLDTLHGYQEQLGERHPESEPFARDLAS